MPCDGCRFEAGGLYGLCGGEVVLFRWVGVKVVELGGSALVGAEELPTTVAHGEIREIVVAGKRGAVGRTSEKERSGARGFGAAEERCGHGNPIEGDARRSGYTGYC